MRIFALRVAALVIVERHGGHAEAEKWLVKGVQNKIYREGDHQMREQGEGLCMGGVEGVTIPVVSSL